MFAFTSLAGEGSVLAVYGRGGDVVGFNVEADINVFGDVEVVGDIEIEVKTSGVVATGVYTEVAG